MVLKIKKTLEALQQNDSLHNHFLLNIRQKKELVCFKNELSLALDAFKKSHDLVVVVSYLYNARGFVQSIASPLDKEDVLNSVFGGFCVGK